MSGLSIHDAQNMRYEIRNLMLVVLLSMALSNLPVAYAATPDLEENKKTNEPAIDSDKVESNKTDEPAIDNDKAENNKADEPAIDSDKKDVIKSIEFENNRKYKDKKLLKKLDFEVGDYIDPILAESGRRIIIEFYPLDEQELNSYISSFINNGFNGFLIKKYEKQKSGQTFILLKKPK